MARRKKKEEEVQHQKTGWWGGNLWSFWGMPVFGLGVTSVCPIGISGLPEDSANSGRGDCNEISLSRYSSDVLLRTPVATDAAVWRQSNVDDGRRHAPPQMEEAHEEQHAAGRIMNTLLLWGLTVWTEFCVSLKTLSILWTLLPLRHTFCILKLLCNIKRSFWSYFL